MYRTTIIFSLVACIAAGVASCLTGGGSTVTSGVVNRQPAPTAGPQATPQDVAADSELDPSNPAYLLRTRGFPRDVPLSQAVAEFNARAEKNPVGKTQPPLTAEEVVASIRDWSLKEEPIDPERYREFQAIAKTGTMPKGSYFCFNAGTISRNGYDIDAWHVYLRIKLDVNPDDQVGVPAYSRLIRTKYIDSRPTKLP
jgi:hypothetical protein